MLASVIIITKNQINFLKKSLPILLKQKLDGKFEIIVVDSGSTDGSKEYTKTLGIKLVNYKEKFNYSKAFNKGSTLAKGKYLVRLSGDAIPVGTSWISEMIKPFKDRKVGGVFGRYTITGRKGWDYPDWWPPSRFPKKETKYYIEPKFLMGVFGIGGSKVFDFAGGACAVRKGIYDKRGFNENLIEAEDAEYSWFLHLIGYDVVCNPKAVVVHEHIINKFKTVRNYMGLRKWSLIFRWEILKYWIKRAFGKDPYSEIRFLSS